MAQSGSLLATVVDWTTHRRIGFSHLVSLGDMADVDFGDMLDYLGADHHTRAILLYIESITHAHELILGMNVDPQFGPVLLFGHCGTATEVIMDRAIALPPLNMNPPAR